MMRSSLLDFNGSVLKVATNLNPPFVTYNESKLPYGGFEITMLNELSKFYNFKFNLIDCKSNWGVLLPNNSWTGIIGKISNKEADFGLSAITITLQRSEVVQFSSPHYISSITFITPPPIRGQSLEVVFEPFQSTVWICFSFAVILMIANVWLLSQYYRQLKSLSFKWFMVTLVLKQAVIRRIPKQQPIRLLLSGWLMACLVFNQGYGSRLYTLMAFPEEIRPINTVEQLALAQKMGEIQAVATSSSLFYGLLKRSENGFFKTLGQLLKPIEDKNIGIELVRDKNRTAHAFISSRDNLLYSVLKISKHQFHIPPHNDDATIYFAQMAVPMQKGFPYVKQFNSFLAHVISAGLIDYWKRLEYRKIDLSFELNLPDPQPLDSLKLKQFKSVLFICLYMIIGSALLFLFEFILDHFILLKILSKNYLI